MLEIEARHQYYLEKPGQPQTPEKVPAKLRPLLRLERIVSLDNLVSHSCAAGTSGQRS